MRFDFRLPQGRPEVPHGGWTHANIWTTKLDPAARLTLAKKRFAVARLDGFGIVRVKLVRRTGLAPVRGFPQTFLRGPRLLFRTAAQNLVRRERFALSCPKALALEASVSAVPPAADGGPLRTCTEISWFVATRRVYWSNSPLNLEHSVRFELTLVRVRTPLGYPVSRRVL